MYSKNINNKNTILVTPKWIDTSFPNERRKDNGAGWQGTEMRRS